MSSAWGPRISYGKFVGIGFLDNGDETAIATISGVSSSEIEHSVILQGVIQFANVGADTTSIQVKMYRGTMADGWSIGQLVIELDNIEAATFPFPWLFPDDLTPGAVDVFYTLTAQAIDASGATTVTGNDCYATVY